MSLENDEARKNEHVIAIAGELSKVGCGEHLQTILGGNKVQVSISHIRDTQMESAGGRHNNDLEDFRSISIVPTCQEFLSGWASPFPPAKILCPTLLKCCGQFCYITRLFLCTI